MAPGDVNPTQGFRPPDRYLKWEPEEAYWRANWETRPYVSADRGFDYYRPAYRYGFDSAHRYGNRPWSEVEHQLRTGWDGYEHRGSHGHTWEHIKEAVRDAWHRVTNG